MQAADLEFFIANQDALVEQYGGRVLLIHDAQVAGVFVTPLEAYLDAKLRFRPGTFTIQRCEAGPDAYTVTITSHELVA